MAKHVPEEKKGEVLDTPEIVAVFDIFDTPESE